MERNAAFLDLSPALHCWDLRSSKLPVKLGKEYIAHMHVDAGEAKEKKVNWSYKCLQFRGIFNCLFKNPLGWHCTGWVLPSKGEVKKGRKKLAQESAQSPLSFPRSSPWPLCPCTFFSLLINLFRKYCFLFGISFVPSLHHSNRQQTAVRTTEVVGLLR